MARPRVKSIFKYKHSLLDHNQAYNLHKRITSGKTSLSKLKTRNEQDRSDEVKQRIWEMEDLLEFIIAVEESGDYKLRMEAMNSRFFIERELESLKAECQLEFEFMDNVIDGVVNER